jgi:hypothetical protein
MIPTDKVRQPVLGEMLHCAVCNGDCGVVDKKYIDEFNRLTEDRQHQLYTPYPDDWFLSYDGCEERDSTDDEILHYLGL